MSHYNGIVILPKDDASAEEIEEELEWYRGNRGRLHSDVLDLVVYWSEEMRVPEWDEACDCGLWKVKIDAMHEAMEQVGQGPLGDLTPEEMEARVAKRQEVHAAYMEAHREEAETPLADCTLCGGSGTYRTRRNPNGKWDWFEIGGRWSGHANEYNIFLLRDVFPDFRSFVVVTPDGTWHERGNMGWWGTIRDDAGEQVWHERCRELFAQYPDHIAVLVDFHT